MASARSAAGSRSTASRREPRATPRYSPWALTCPPPALHASLLEPLGPGGSRRYRTATFDVRTEKPRAEPLLLAPPDAVPVLDGVFLLRPQLNDAWDLRIFLEVDFQETLGCPTFDSRT